MDRENTKVNNIIRAEKEIEEEIRVFINNS